MTDERLTHVDPIKNRIYIYFEGKMDLERILRLKQAYKDAIELCKPGFTVLTYATKFVPGSPEVQEVVKEMTYYAEKAGLRKVARVVGKTPLGGMQINRLAKTKTKYPARHFKTEIEAEMYLDSDEM
ncbi:hypothetical protein JXO52_12815 [bacterium]|nr:hypothetical protein [bacterium]